MNQSTQHVHNPKTIPLVFLALFALVSALLGVSPAAASTTQQKIIQSTTAYGSIACPICTFDMSQYTGVLNEAEVQGLLLALNDEYHAWAVYDQVIQDYGDIAPFVAIRQSEAQHIRMLKTLFATYGVPVPNNPWIGNAPHFASVEQACATGVAAEVDNAALYDTLFASTPRQDILLVYGNLQRASLQRHLPAFETCGATSGMGPGMGTGPGTGTNPGMGTGPGTGTNPGMGTGPGTGTNPGTGTCTSTTPGTCDGNGVANNDNSTSKRHGGKWGGGN